MAFGSNKIHCLKFEITKSTHIWSKLNIKIHHARVSQGRKCNVEYDISIEIHNST